MLAPIQISDEMREFYHSLSYDEQQEFINSLDNDTFISFRYFSDLMLRNPQIVPEGAWKFIVLIGGRGNGKTKTGASESRKQVYANNDAMMFIAPTFTDLEETMIPQFQEEFPLYHRPIWLPGKKLIKCHNGINIMCKTTEQASIRGKNTKFFWLDEVPNCWKGDPDKQLREFLIFAANIRRGAAQGVITTTGEPTPLFRLLFDMAKDKPNRCKLVFMGKTADNKWLNPDTADDLYGMYGNTRFAKQELEGIVDFTADGALWTQKLINDTRIASTKPNATVDDHIFTVANPPNPKNFYPNKLPLRFFYRFVIGVDPAMSISETSDETGIVVAGLGNNMQVYILEDRSGKYTPPEITAIVQELRAKYTYAGILKTTKVVVETNNGGDWVTYALRTVDRFIDKDIVPLHVNEAKMTRAHYQVGYWDQNRAHIVGYMPQLEQQMCFFTGAKDQKSPDRFDAMVYCVQELAAEPNFNNRNFSALPRM